MNSLNFSGPPFVDAPPCDQNAISLFQEWASMFPPAFKLSGNGKAALFEDPKITWLEEGLRKHQGVGVAGRNVVELGPLEAGHTYMLDRLGAKHIDSVESNSIAFLKCLVVKEVLGLPSARFHLGNALPFLEAVKIPYNLGICSGILYHMVDPLRLLRLLSSSCETIYLWSNTYSEELFRAQPHMRPRFGPPKEVTEEGFTYTLHPHSYGDVQNYSAFWGGVAPSSCWLTPADIVRAVEHVGFRVLEVKHEDNPYGIALHVLASRVAPVPA